MEKLISILLIVLYPFLILARGLNMLSGADPLRLREPQSPSLWVTRDANLDPASYFSAASFVEGNGHGSFGAMPRRMLQALGRLFAPRRTTVGSGRMQDIPDEVYTLW